MDKFCLLIIVRTQTLQSQPIHNRFSTFTLKYRFTLDSSHHHHTPLYIEILSREISMWQVCATYIWISFTKLVLIDVQLYTHSRSDNFKLNFSLTNFSTTMDMKRIQKRPQKITMVRFSTYLKYFYLNTQNSCFCA